MAAISGHNNVFAKSVYARRYFIRPKTDLLDFLTQKASYVNGSWDSPEKVVTVRDLVQFVADNRIQGIPGRDGFNGYSPP
jgi:hypothetical protein